MDFVFAGICLFVDDPRTKNGKNGSRGKVVIFPNGKNHAHPHEEAGKSGGPALDAEHADVPAHSTFLLVRGAAEVDHRKWGPPLKVRFPDGVRLVFPVENEDIHFDPPPTGDPGPLDDLPFVQEFCQGTFNQNVVTSKRDAVAALATIPGGPLTTHVNDTAARVVHLELADEVIIRAHPFDGDEPRVLKVRGPNASVVMANVVLPDAFNGHADEVIHTTLFCTLLDHGGDHLNTPAPQVRPALPFDPGLIDQLTLTGTCSPVRR